MQREVRGERPTVGGRVSGTGPVPPITAYRARVADGPQRGQVPTLFEGSHRLRVLPRRLVEAFVNPDVGGEERQRRWLLAICLLLLMPPLAGFALVDVLAGRSAEGAAGFGLLGFAAVTLLLGRYIGDTRWVFRAPAIGVLALTAWLTYLGSGRGLVLVWLYLLPPPLYYVFGAREGTAWLLLSCALFFTVVTTGVGAAYPPELAVRFVVTYGLTGLISLGIERSRATLYRQLDEERRRLEAALGDVRTLSEMLPMCAWCRKVRDDDGFWSQIEDYLDRRTGTQVSHGLCPDCSERLSRPSRA